MENMLRQNTTKIEELAERDKNSKIQSKLEEYKKSKD